MHTSQPTDDQNFGSGKDPLRSLLADMIRQSGKSRAEIVDRMSERLGYRVSLHTLNDCTSQEKTLARFPLEWARAFGEVLGDDRLERFVLGPRLRKLLALGEREMNAVRDERERAALREELLAER